MSPNFLKTFASSNFAKSTFQPFKSQNNNSEDSSTNSSRTTESNTSHSPDRQRRPYTHSPKMGPPLDNEKDDIKPQPPQPSPKMSPMSASPKMGYPTPKELEYEERIKLLEEQLNHTKEMVRKSEQERLAANEELSSVRDALHIRESFTEGLEKQNDYLSSEVESLRGELGGTKTAMDALLNRFDDKPLGQEKMEKSWKRMKNLVEQMRESCICPMCYETLKKEKWASLRCGHVFCLSCLSQYSNAHKDTWKNSPTAMGVYPGPDCPECRLPVLPSSSSSAKSPFETGHPDLGTGKWRVWMLEELLRLLEKDEIKEAEEEKEWKEEKERFRRGEVPLKNEGSDNEEENKRDTENTMDVDEEGSKQKEDYFEMLNERRRTPYSNNEYHGHSESPATHAGS